MQAVRTLLNKVLIAFNVLLFVMMTVVGTYQIVTRYFFNSPSTYSEEIVTYSFTWLSILSAAYVFGQRGHLCMEFVYHKITGKNRVYLDILSEVLVIIFAVLLLGYGGFVMAEQNTHQVTASLGVSMAAMYSVLPIAGALITVFGLFNLADMFKKLKDPNVVNYGVNDHSDE